MNGPAKQISMNLAGVDLVLDAGKCVYVPADRALFVADLHLGKDTTFRKLGVPVPTGSSKNTLSRLIELVQHYAPTHLIILGDLFHAKTSMCTSTSAAFEAFRKQTTHVRFSLVRGNHDRWIESPPKSWFAELITGPSRLGAVHVAHEPQINGNRFPIVLCGHIHPSYRLQTTGRRQHERLPCFWWTDHHLILPAFGEFTGSKSVAIATGERIWITTQQAIYEVPNIRPIPSISKA